VRSVVRRIVRIVVDSVVSMGFVVGYRFVFVWIVRRDCVVECKNVWIS